jgi:hypothetical protein
LPKRASPGELVAILRDGRFGPAAPGPTTLSEITREVLLRGASSSAAGSNHASAVRASRINPLIPNRSLGLFGSGTPIPRASILDPAGQTCGRWTRPSAGAARRACPSWHGKTRPGARRASAKPLNEKSFLGSFGFPNRLGAIASQHGTGYGHVPHRSARASRKAPAPPLCRSSSRSCQEPAAERERQCSRI